MIVTTDLFGHEGDTAIKRRDRALKTVADNSGDWMGLALIALRNSIPVPDVNREEFTVEDIKRWIVPMVGKPHSHNAYGALMRAAMLQNIIEDTGKWTRSKSLKSKARKIPIYRWG